MGYPAVTFKDARKDKRGQTQYRIHFSVRGRRHFGEGVLSDLSASGCGIKSAVPVRQGEILELTVYSPDGQAIGIDESVIRWVRPDGFGVSFTQMRRPAKMWIADICRRLSLQA
ncbi:MAG: PilZ domain-containing protein [Nitrospiraceae bacterium]